MIAYPTRDDALRLPVGLDDLVHFVYLAVQATCGDKSRQLSAEEQRKSSDGKTSNGLTN